MDEVVGELKTIREEQTLQSHKLSEHEDRIEKLSLTLAVFFCFQNNTASYLRFAKLFQD